LLKEKLIATFSYHRIIPVIMIFCQLPTLSYANFPLLLRDQKKDLTGFSLSLSTGSAINYQEFVFNNEGQISDIHYIPAINEALIHFGINYNIQLVDRIYLGTELSWLYYETLLRPNQTIYVHPLLGQWTIPAWALLSVPLSDVMLVYQTDNNTLFQLGLTYLWGVCATINTPINDHLSMNFKTRWFFDRVLYNDGIHDFHFLLGLNYHF
jgi:hypothetical protein